MNLGIYISNLSDKEQLMYINMFVDKYLHDKNVYDISVFYDNVDFNPHNIKCGMFNSTDLWSFNGNLIVTSLDALITAQKVVNNINIFLYYGWDKKKNVLGLAAIAQNVPTICRSEKNAKEFSRLVGVDPIGISDNFDNIIDIISRCKDEYKSNHNNVYQTA